jgi:hypothetical protein
MRKIRLKLIARPDGGLRVRSPDLPGLVLSGKYPGAVLADVLPAIDGILGQVWPTPVQEQSE